MSDRPIHVCQIIEAKIVLKALAERSPEAGRVPGSDVNSNVTGPDATPVAYDDPDHGYGI